MGLKSHDDDAASNKLHEERHGVPNVLTAHSIERLNKQIRSAGNPALLHRFAKPSKRTDTQIRTAVCRDTDVIEIEILDQLKPVLSSIGSRKLHLPCKAATL